MLTDVRIPDLNYKLLLLVKLNPDLKMLVAENLSVLDLKNGKGSEVKQHVEDGGVNMAHKKGSKCGCKHKGKKR